MLVPDFGPTMNVIAYCPFQDAVSAEAVGESGRIVSDAAHKPTKLFRRSRVIGFSSGYIYDCAECRRSSHPSDHGVRAEHTVSNIGQRDRLVAPGAQPNRIRRLLARIDDCAIHGDSPREKTPRRAAREVTSYDCVEF
jgi:hypothetical protein